MERGPSIKDVAKAADVSVGTVSNVLNHPDIVSPTSKQRVDEAIAQLGFVPSDTGRSLRAGKSRLVGVIVLNIANPFFSEAARAIENRLALERLYPMVCSSDGDPTKEKNLLQQLASLQVRGVILVPSEQAASNIRVLQKRKIPLVLMDHAPISDDISTVSVDDKTGAAEAVKHLVDLGHRNIVFINGPIRIQQSQVRRDGVSEAREAASSPIRITEVNASTFDSAAGSRAMESILADHPEISAVFCASDQLAIGAMRTIRHHGMGIPEDFSVVGFDDIPAASELITPLTTVRQPMADLGRTAAELLIEEGGTSQVSFVPKLVVRESASSPA